MFRKGILTTLTILDDSEFEKIMKMAVRLCELEPDFGSGVSRYSKTDFLQAVYDHNEVYLITIDDFSLITFIDPQDGYRDNTYTLVLPKIEYKRLPKPVEITYELNASLSSPEATSFYIKKDGKEVFSAHTEDLDDWYPSGIIHYFPENLGVV